MGLKRVSWVRRYQGQCRALRPLGHQGYRLRNHKKDQPLCSGYTGPLTPCTEEKTGLRSTNPMYGRRPLTPAASPAGACSVP